MLKNIKFKGSPITLVGRSIRENYVAPDFKAVSLELKEVSLKDFKGKIKVIASFPSLDTPVCDLELKEFNQRAASFSQEVAVLGISKDLPFAQQRFCQANSIKNVITLSDYKYSSFGINYGLLIKELNLLARAVLILDKNDTLRYAQLVEELTLAPDYTQVLAALEEVVKTAPLAVKEQLPSRCRPCEVGTPPLAKGPIDKFIAAHPLWGFKDNERLVKEIKFKDSLEAKYFLDLVSIISEEQAHHPTLTLSYNKLKISLTTHASGGVTENDFIIAKIIDELT